MKFTRILTYFTLSLKSMKVNEIKILYKDWIFENFYMFLFKYILILLLLTYFL